MAKQVTREQAERKRTQAVAFMERIGQPDRADEFESMSTDEYAEQRGLRLTNYSALTLIQGWIEAEDQRAMRD